MPTYWGWAIVSVLCYAVGFMLAGISIFMVWKFGESFGTTELERKAYGATHAALHVGGIATAFCIGGYLNEKRPWRALLAMAVLTVVGAYSIQNIAGFAAKTRVAVADAAEINSARALAAYEAQRADLQNRRNWAENITINVRDYSPSDRLQAKRRVNEYQKQLDALKPPTMTAETVLGDASASLFARVMGYDLFAVSAFAVIMLAILAYVVEAYMFVLGTERAARAWGVVHFPNLSDDGDDLSGSDRLNGTQDLEPRRDAASSATNKVAREVAACLATSSQMHRQAPSSTEVAAEVATRGTTNEIEVATEATPIPKREPSGAALYSEDAIAPEVANDIREHVQAVVAALLEAGYGTLVATDVIRGAYAGVCQRIKQDRMHPDHFLGALKRLYPHKRIKMRGGKDAGRFITHYLLAPGDIMSCNRLKTPA